MVATLINDYQFVFYLFCMMGFALQAGKFHRNRSAERLFLACASASWAFAVMSFVIPGSWHGNLAQHAALIFLWMATVWACVLLGKTLEIFARLNQEPTAG